MMFGKRIQLLIKARTLYFRFLPALEKHTGCGQRMALYC